MTESKQQRDAMSEQLGQTRIDDLFKVEDLAVKWNISVIKVYDIFCKNHIDFYCILERRKDQTGKIYYIYVEPEDDLLVEVNSPDYEHKHMWRSLNEEYFKKLYISERDVVKLERDLPFLTDVVIDESDESEGVCTTDIARNLERLMQKNPSIKSISERQAEFNGMTADDLDQHIKNSPNMRKGDRHALKAARWYLAGVAPQEKIYYKVYPKKPPIKNDARYVRDLLEKAKKILNLNQKKI